MKRIHHLKTWPEPFRATECGDKLFEFRRDDRGFAVGDRMEVTYVLYGRHGVPGGYVVMGLVALPDDARRTP